MLVKAKRTHNAYVVRCCFCMREDLILKDVNPDESPREYTDTPKRRKRMQKIAEHMRREEEKICSAVVVEITSQSEEQSSARAAALVHMTPIVRESRNPAESSWNKFEDFADPTFSTEVVNRESPNKSSEVDD